MIASGAVHLTDGPRSFIGQRLHYDRARQIVTVSGAVGNDARIYSSQGDGRGYFIWRGPQLRWYPADDRIEAPGARIIAGGS